MMKKCVKILLAAMLAIVMVAGGTACKDDKGEDTKKDVLRVFTYSGQEFEAVSMDSVMKAIEEKVGVRISMEGATAEDYYTKLTPMISTGDFPDLIWTDPENSYGAFQEWSKPEQDILWNLDQLLIGNEDRYPYLTKLIYSNQYKNIMYHGGHYIVPAVQTSTAWAIYYRADWLEAIGFVDENGKAKAPVTLDEFEQVMKGFSGKGKFDDKEATTYGISPNTANFYVNPLYGAFGITPDWDITESGEVSYMYAREEFKPYLQWMNAMFKKGYIEPTFFQNTGFTDRDSWRNGRVGCIMTNGEGHMEWVVGDFENNQGAGKVIVGPPLLGTGNVSTDTGCVLGVAGERGYSNWGGYYGGYSITKDTKDPYKALDFLEYIVSPEGSTLRLYGIEGSHYDIDADGRVIPNVEGRQSERVNYFGDVTNVDGTTSPAGLHDMGSRFGYAVDWDHFEATGEIAIATDIGSLFPRYSDLVQSALGYTQYLQTSRLNNVTAFPSTIDLKKAEVMNISSQFINKAIIGSVNLTTDWDKMIQDLNSAGYAQVKAVMQETALELGIIE